MSQMPPSSVPLRRLRRALRLTRLGLVCERLARAFWPLWAIALASCAALLLGLHDIAPIEIVWAAMLAAPLGALAALAHGLRAFRWPSRAEARARLDATLPGRPIAALEDTQAIGAGDGASRAVWEAHRQRMAQRLRAVRAAAPRMSLTRRDPFGLRYVALMLFGAGLLFGSAWRVDSLGDMVPGQADALAGGPVWEGWIEPPRYTGQPSLYLADLGAGEIEVPKGSKVLARLYGEVGALTLTETVSGRIEDTGSVSDPVQEFTITQPGEIAINGRGGRVWQVLMAPDQTPRVTIDEALATEALGEMSLPFSAEDDFGIVGGQAVIRLDLAAVDRRFGRALAPEPRPDLVIALPMPIAGGRDRFSEVLVENLSEHPWANLPVQIHLQVEDAVGQVGRSETLSETLPGRRFFVPLAKAVIEQRQALLWNRENAPALAQILRAISHRPEGLFRSETEYLRLRFAIRELENTLRFGDGLSDARRDELAKALWDLALRLEEGSLSSALERLRRAQEQLAEAIRDGASDAEIDRLMQEMREALAEYMRQLAEQAEPQDPDQAQAQDQMEMSADQLQQLLDRLQQLMQEGRMAEAAQLLEQLRQLMENMQVTQGGQGGQGSPGQQALQELQEMLRDQQDLSDESFRELQDQFNQPPGQSGPQPGQRQGQQPGQQPGQQSGQQSGQGQQPGQGQAPGTGLEPGEGPGGSGMSLADRQQALREALRQAQEGLPGGGAASDEALGRAGEAMEGAEQALRGDNLPGALDDQARAMEALREGMQALSEEMAQQQPGGPGQPGQGAGQNPDGPGRDPLGRLSGNDGAPQTNDGLLPGESPAGRALELERELRRRATEQERPELERDYLNRLLDRF